MQRLAAPRRASSASQRARTRRVGGGRRSRSASAARRYSPVPPTTIGRRARGEQRVDLGVRAAGELAGAEARPSTRQHADAAGARAARAAPRRRGAGEDLQPGVELQRVGGDRDGILAVGAQRVGERDRDAPSCRRRSARTARRSRRRIARDGGGADARPGNVSDDGRTHRQRALDGGRTRASAPSRRRRRPRDALGGRPCDVAVVFFGGAHLAAPEATLEGVHDALAPAELVGCGAGGVIGDAARGRGRHRRVRVGRGARRRRGHRVPRRGRGDRRRRSACSRACPIWTARPARSCSPTRTPSRPTRCCASCRAPSPMLPLLGGLASARSPDGRDAAAAAATRS